MTELFDNRYKTNSLRLPEREYSEPGSYFVTICTHDRTSYFGEVIDGEIILNDIGNIVRNIRYEIPVHFPHIELDACVIMPNHIHGIITIIPIETHDTNEQYFCRDNSGIISTEKQKLRRNMIIPKIIGKFKMQTAKAINQIIEKQGKFRQSNYYEHVIRNDADFERIHTYISNNPLKRKNDEYYR